MHSFLQEVQKQQKIVEFFSSFETHNSNFKSRDFRQRGGGNLYCALRYFHIASYGLKDIFETPL